MEKMKATVFHSPNRLVTVSTLLEPGANRR
jgi:hypothetical protein